MSASDIYDLQACAVRKHKLHLNINKRHVMRFVIRFMTVFPRWFLARWNFCIRHILLLFENIVNVIIFTLFIYFFSLSVRASLRLQRFLLFHLFRNILDMKSIFFDDINYILLWMFSQFSTTLFLPLFFILVDKGFPNKAWFSFHIFCHRSMKVQ